MTRTRLKKLYDRINLCEAESKRILEDVNSIYISKYITGLETSYIENQKDRIEVTIDRINNLKNCLKDDGYKEDGFLVYYENEISQIEDSLCFIESNLI